MPPLAKQRQAFAFFESKARCGGIQGVVSLIPRQAVVSLKEIQGVISLKPCQPYHRRRR